MFLILKKNQERRSGSQLSKKLAKIASNEIVLQAIIGEGEFGTVYKGTYNGVKKIKENILFLTVLLYLLQFRRNKWLLKS